MEASAEVPTANLANPIVPPSPKIVTSSSSVNDAKKMRDSLRFEVARHPDDFIVFATEAGARQFLGKHRGDAEHETNPRIISRGVVGYWGNKTIVVLPWDSLEGFQ
jgi:hypothetical protein